jgi:hypothetical protein
MPQAVAFIFIGILTAVGQMLQSTTPITWKLALGRAMTTGGMALVAGAALAIFPDLPFLAQLGIAAALASLGSSGVEIALQKILNR